MNDNNTSSADYADYEFFPITHCNLCGETERDILFSITNTVIPVTSVICANCGLVYLKEALTEEVAYRFYSSDEWRSVVYQQTETVDFLENLFQGQAERGQLAVDFIKTVIGDISGKSSLDIGCAAGGFVHILQTESVIASGIEPSKSYSDYGRQQYGLNIIQNSFENISFDDTRYDLILCMRTLNHLLNPTQSLAKIRGMLADGGYIYLEVLNFPHALRRKAVDKCIKIDHPYMFSVRTITGFLAKAGFELIAFDTDLDNQYQFGSLNHLHVIARAVSSPKPYYPPPLAAIEAKLECNLAVTQFLSSL